MKNVYFASDFHLGIDTDHPSELREKHIVRWLESIKNEAKAIYLLGDVLDYWFEYNATVPKGFTRLFGKIAELTDAGVHIEWYTGNHDMWDFGYFEKELGVKIYKEAQVRMINGKKCYLCHADGLGPGDKKYKFIKAVFSNPFCQFLFSLLPSRLGLWLMRGSSQSSRDSQDCSEEYLLKKEDTLFAHFKNIAASDDIDYFIYGHLHSGKRSILENYQSECINLGDWTRLYTYAVMNDNGHLEMRKYPIVD